MNKRATVVILMSAFLLSACGGDSDSSGRVVSGGTGSNGSSSGSDNTNPSVAQCKVQGKRVSIPHEGICNITLPEVNGGKESLLKCSTGRITLNGVAIDGMELYGHIFQCAK